ncbi:MAG: hypothetical protein DRH26_01400 [Deltaproteobacteria bacterium]|nr:MAG: hypothetical protein DRH26_01400 [Deltaproteobacteria bacterium]
MLNFTVFRETMKPLGALLKFSQGHDKSTMQAFYIAVKDHFTDSEFKEVCLKYLQIDENFPAPASLIKLKAKIPVPDKLTLFDAFKGTIHCSKRAPCSLEDYERLEKEKNRQPTQKEQELTCWAIEVGKYFAGKIPPDLQYVSEEDLSWMYKDWCIAYEKFMKDYEAGNSIRIDFDKLHEIRINIPSNFNDVLRLEERYRA